MFMLRKCRLPVVTQRLPATTDGMSKISFSAIATSRCLKTSVNGAGGLLPTSVFMNMRTLCKNAYQASAFSTMNRETIMGSGHDVKNTPRKRSKKKAGPVVLTSEGTIEGKEHPQFLRAYAYSTAEEYDLKRIANALREQKLYMQQPLTGDLTGEVIFSRAIYPQDASGPARDMFIFSEGSIVFWNFSPIERQTVLKFLQNYSLSPYADETVLQEAEDMDYEFIADERSKLNDGLIQLSGSEDEKQTILDKFAFSNAISFSVKLSIWEAKLDAFADSIEDVTGDIASGGHIRLSRNDVFRKTGALYALRHSINLSSGLLDTPDFYWDRPELERLFVATTNHMNLPRRVRVMNERLSHCTELMDLLASNLNDKHHVRLEWMIIVLIMVEVVFEFLHYFERWATHDNEESKSPLPVQ